MVGNIPLINAVDYSAMVNLMNTLMRFGVMDTFDVVTVDSRREVYAFDVKDELYFFMFDKVLR